MCVLSARGLLMATKHTRVQELSKTELKDYLIPFGILSQNEASELEGKFCCSTSHYLRKHAIYHVRPCRHSLAASIVVVFACMLVCSIYIERGMDGKAFCSLSREDVAILFPDKSQFLLGVKLYKEIQIIRKQTMETSSDCDLESVEESSQCNSLSSRRLSLDHQASSSKSSQYNSLSSGRPTSLDHQVSSTKRKDTVLGKYSLPKFSPDVWKRPSRLTSSIPLSSEIN